MRAHTHSSQRNEHIERVIVISGYNVDATVSGAAAVLTIIAQNELNDVDAALPLVNKPNGYTRPARVRRLCCIR